MFIQDIIDVLEQYAPPALQESFDNAGLLVGDAARSCTGVLCTLDATEMVVEEAAASGCNLMVTYHPIIFRGLKQITSKSYVERAVTRAIRQDIAIYAIHTNLDNVPNGVNGKIASLLSLHGLRPLMEKAGPDTGTGWIGTLPAPTEETVFLQQLKDIFNLSVIRHSPLLSRPVSRVAICGGAGSFLTASALGAGADWLVTADIKYHEFFAAEDKMVLADIGHYESEQFTVDLLVDILREKFSTFAVLYSKTRTNPVHYFI